MTGATVVALCNEGRVFVYTRRVSKMKRFKVLLTAVALLAFCAATAEPSPWKVGDPNNLGTARVRALDECNAKVVRYDVFDKWINFEFSVYGACMAEEGQSG